MKNCVMCGKEYGWQEWGKYIYKNSNICYACHSDAGNKDKRCACGRIYNFERVSDDKKPQVRV